MQRDQVNKKDVATPTGNHVKVGQRATGCPKDRSSFNRFYPQVVREEHAENGDSFVIVRSGDRTRDVAGNYGNQTRSDQTGAFVLKRQSIIFYLEKFLSQFFRKSFLYFYLEKH